MSVPIHSATVQQDTDYVRRATSAMSAQGWKKPTPVICLVVAVVAAGVVGTSTGSWFGVFGFAVAVGLFMTLFPRLVFRRLTRARVRLLGPAVTYDFYVGHYVRRANDEEKRFEYTDFDQLARAGDGWLLRNAALRLWVYFPSETLTEQVIRAIRSVIEGR